MSVSSWRTSGVRNEPVGLACLLSQFIFQFQLSYMLQIKIPVIITGNVFTGRLKLSSEDDALISLGNEFHNFGAELENDPSKRHILDLGTYKEPSVVGP